MKYSYDAVIVGLGPSGSRVFQKLSKMGFNVLGIERNEKLATKPCGEAVPVELPPLLNDVKFDDEIIENTISRATVLDVNGKVKKILDFKEVVGYIINKEALLRRLVEDGCSHGGDVLLNHSVVSVSLDGRVKVGGGLEFRGKIIICSDGCSGVCSKHFPHRHYVTTYQYKIKGSRGESGTVYFVFDKNLTGYYWIFPKESGLYNVGVGGIKINPKHLISKFIKNVKLFNVKTVIDEGGAPIPIRGPVKPLVKGRLLALGDRAALAFSFTGEGIRPAIVSANCAVKVVSKYLELDDESLLLDYEREVLKVLGGPIFNSNRMLELFEKMPSFLREIVISRINTSLAKRILLGLEVSGEPQYTVHRLQQSKDTCFR